MMILLSVGTLSYIQYMYLSYDERTTKYGIHCILLKVLKTIPPTLRSGTELPVIATYYLPSSYGPYLAKYLYTVLRYYVVSVSSHSLSAQYTKLDEDE